VACRPSGCARAFTQAMGWTTVEESPPAEFVIGYWRSDRTEPIADREQFRHATEGVTQKVLFSFRFRRLDEGHVEVDTETRVLCVGRGSKLRFWPYWLAIKPFSGWIRREILKLIKKEAEARARMETLA
jgi:hypothetical protein